jgi:hypothetical protein
MEKQRGSFGKQIVSVQNIGVRLIGILASLISVALLSAPGTSAQQQTPKLTPSYAKAALASLHAIESDISSAQDRAGAMPAADPTQKIIAASDAAAVTEQDASVSKLLHQLYLLRLHDNKILAAYEKIIEVESAVENSDEWTTKKQKELAAAQLADNQESIEKREESCFWQLEDSLRQRAPQNITACSEWIRRAKLAGTGPVTPPAKDENPPAQRSERRGFSD